MKKALIVLLTLLVASAMAFANGSSEQGSAAKGGHIKIGLSFSDFETPRWPVEDALMTKLAYAKGIQVISQVANHDVKLQNDQIENMITQGVQVLIIVAEDGSAAASAVNDAAAAGIKTIAYDRLIKSDKLAAYLSFDNVAVGEAQAKGVLAVVNHGNFVLLGGSPTDNNAKLFRQGQMNVLQPLIDNGQIKVVADQWVPNWSGTQAESIMENILTANNNQIDAVVSSNDDTALGALQALKAQGLAGKVPLSGQDATAAGCNSIVKGELTMTVFKDVRLLSPLAIDTAIKLANNEPIDGLQNISLALLTGDKSAQGTVPCKFLPIVSVNKDNVYDVVVKSGFQPYDDVYRDIPDSQRPPRPAGM